MLPNKPAPAANRSIQTRGPLVVESRCPDTQIKQAAFMIGQQVALDLKAAGFRQKAEMQAPLEHPLNHSERLDAADYKSIVGPEGLQVFKGRGPLVAKLSGNQILRAVVSQVNHEFQPRKMNGKKSLSNFYAELTRSLTKLGMTFHANVGTSSEPVAGQEMDTSNLTSVNGVVAKISQLFRDDSYHAGAEDTKPAAKRKRQLPTEDRETLRRQDAVEVLSRGHSDQPAVQEDLEPLPVDAEVLLTPEDKLDILDRLGHNNLLQNKNHRAH